MLPGRNRRYMKSWHGICPDSPNTERSLSTDRLRRAGSLAFMIGQMGGVDEEQSDLFGSFPRLGLPLGGSAPRSLSRSDADRFPAHAMPGHLVPDRGFKGGADVVRTPPNRVDR